MTHPVNSFIYELIMAVTSTDWDFLVTVLISINILQWKVLVQIDMELDGPVMILRPAPSASSFLVSMSHMHCYVWPLYLTCFRLQSHHS